MPQPGLILVTGRGGEGRDVLDACRAAGFTMGGVLIAGGGESGDVNGVPVLGAAEDWEAHLGGEGWVLAVDSAARRRLGEALLARGERLPPIVHPHGWLSPCATVGAGSVLMPGVVVSANATIGRFCIVNANCTLDHDNRLEDGVHLSPGVTFPGGVICLEEAFVGAAVVALPRITIGRRALVGAGSVVTRDVPDDATVAGNPARIR